MNKFHITLYGGHGDTFKIFTNFEDKGYAKIPVVNFGFPINSKAPIGEWSDRLFNINSYCSSHGLTAEHAPTKIGVILEEVINTNAQKSVLSETIMGRLHAIREFCNTNSTVLELTPQKIQELDTSIARFTASGVLQVAPGQLQIPGMLELVAQPLPNQVAEQHQNPDNAEDDEQKNNDGEKDDSDEEEQGVGDDGGSTEEVGNTGADSHKRPLLGERPRSVTNPTAD